MRFIFRSDLDIRQWGGSEELWSRAALHLVQRGHSVSASVDGFGRPCDRMDHLIREGIDLRPRRARLPLRERLSSRLRGRRISQHAAPIARFAEAGEEPTLVVFSNGTLFPQMQAARYCLVKGLPFVSIAQANWEGWWPDDHVAERLRAIFSGALRCYFVSDANRRLAEQQIGAALPNAELVCNPFNVGYDASPSWPGTDPAQQLRMACVARLYPQAKGQDVLFEALASPAWRERNWRLELYGEGTAGEGLRRLAQRNGLAERVDFMGVTDDIAGVWARNHILALPSRYEGTPLALIEAMLCSRAALVTDVAGNGELIEDGVNGFLAESPTVPALLRSLEQVWDRRAQLRELGRVAGTTIRGLVPRDPAEDFALRLEKLMLSRDR